ncbi:hypothetical protein RhiirA1_484035 [Rhizophagus irregularis]|uniref:Uncharacterized protein n=1 Tax=Rhizophagus irregularis TaxID=588596 RepID=A0A2N0QJS2_9GLOM|nr:hypothetical protein RhiirA1_484035 [Rhizophagus irregularis]
MSNIETTAHQSQEVAAIAEQTSAGAEEVRSATEEQAYAIEQIEKLSKDLKLQSEQLYKVIQQFDRTHENIRILRNCFNERCEISCYSISRSGTLLMICFNGVFRL